MAYNDNQEDFPLPTPNDDNRNSATFLPKFFRSDRNKKFIDATIDQMVKPGVVEKLSGFAGRRYAKSATVKDNYIVDVTPERENYQFEPVTVYKDDLGNVELLKDYNDFIGQTNSLKGPVLNHSLFNQQEYYSWDPHINWDKFVNFREYYWLPVGPLPIGVFGQSREVISTYTVTVVDEVDNYAYVFSPNGFTRNPRIKLFVGQTYRFEINAPGHPMAFVLSRSIEDTDLGVALDLEVTDILYTKGIKKYVYDVDNKLVETTSDFIEEGVIEFTIGEDIPDTLYYVSKNDVNTSGIVTFAPIEENTEIDVEAEILGKKTYKTGSGIQLSNGMKVFFQGIVTPEKYNAGYWYVEGVGDSIKLIKEQDLEIPSVFTDEIEIPWDAYGYDKYPFEDATAFAGTKDYIVIDRTSADRNPWSRYNRWFHKEVIRVSAEANNQTMDLDQDARAKRPIIEFEAGLKLWNHGSKAKNNVNLIDDYTTDVFSNIEGSLGYNIDGVDLTDGMRVLFTADPDIFVNGKIFEVKFINHNGIRQIALIETDDTNPILEESVLITQGEKYKGKMFWYNGTTWKQSQDKTELNQAPYFDLFDTNGIQLNDETYYPSSNFRGNKLFSYKVGSGSNDVELGFPLTYRNIANVGDVVYEFNLLSDTFTFQEEFHEGNLVSTDTTFLKKYNRQGDDYVWANGWKKAKTKSKQPVIRQYNVDVQKNNFAIDVFDNSGTLTDLVVRVIVNGVKVTNYTISNINGIATVVFDNDLLQDDILVLKCYSDANKNSNGFYEIPIGLERNPLNENLTTLTLGEINDHVNTIVEDHPEFEGTVLGINNLRDIGNTTEYGKRFVQHTGPVNLSLYHLTKKDASLYKALKYARREYAKFKRNFISSATNSGFYGSAKDHVDLIIKNIVSSNNSSSTFYFSDMFGHGAAIKTEHDIEYTGSAYFTLSKEFNLTTISNRAVGVYRNKEQLLYGRDYTFNENFVYVHLDLEVGDIIDVYEYENTNGLYIPPTPTKLGLYPKYFPEMFIDRTYKLLETDFNIPQTDDPSLISFDLYDINSLIPNDEIRVFISPSGSTNFTEITEGFSITTNTDFRTIRFDEPLNGGQTLQIRYPVVVIQGHDGSITRAYNDYRDDLLLELEYRIFNNIKVEYDVNLIDIHDFIGTVDRDTKISKTEIDNIMLGDFQEWLEITGSPDYTNFNFWNQTDSFTYNYFGTRDAEFNNLSGYWRNIYKTYFDTDRPHTHPWEMLGFYIKPTWWNEVYGPAPYTKDNLILWKDLSEGIIREPGQLIVRNKKYIRNNLLNYIPVDSSGKLLSPLECGLVKDFNITRTRNEFSFGDHAPTETAWRRSSEYPFSLITAWTLLQPNHIIGLGFDRSRLIRNKVGNVVYSETNKRIRLADIVFPSVSKDETPVYTAGLINYVANYISVSSSKKYEKYKLELAGLKNQLAVKLGGFADKTKLKLVLDSRSPLNKTSVFVPDENYKIVLNKSNALETATFSGIIIEKTTSGYIISGYDKSNPQFLYNPPRDFASDPAFTVGGISEEYVDWNAGSLYTSGTVVLHENSYFRCKVSHTASNTFDETKFSKLPGLPIVGGVTAKYRKNFEDTVEKLPYGTLLKSVQEVADFMFGYENYLKLQGFKFEHVNNDTGVLESMLLSIKEFMFFVTQNWTSGTLISLSPAANELRFERDYYVVDDIFDNFYEYNILTGNGQRLINEFTSTYRTNSNQFNIRPVNTDDGIFLAKLPLVQIDHVVLIDNETDFADVIFDTVPGYRQERIKLVGYRTDNWNGGLNIPGFFYNEVKILEWQIYTDYSIGDIVKYKEYFYIAKDKHTSDQFFNANYWSLLDDEPASELLPNWDYKVNQFTDFYDLDTDNFDVEQQRLGQHLIGYQKREYLANIIEDDVSQYKFYQGFIQDKGTKNSLTKLFDALSSADKDSLEFYEEWAIRLGQYGAIDNLIEIEYQLDENKYKIEPQIVELVTQVDTTRVDLVYEIPEYQVYNKPYNYNHSPFSLVDNTEIYTKDNGYVRDSDIKGVISGRDAISALDINSLLIGDFIWVTNDNQSWNVLRHVNTPYSVESATIGLPVGYQIDSNNEIQDGFTIYTDRYTDIKVGEYIGLKIRSIPELNGFWKVVYSSLNKIGLKSPTPLNFNIDEFNDSSVIGLTRFVERRFDNIEDVNTNIEYLLSEVDDTIWLDDAGTSSWKVFTNEQIFKIHQEIINPEVEDDGFAGSFSVNETNTILVTSKPFARNNNDVEKVAIYTRFNDSLDLELKQEIEIPDYIGKLSFDASTAVNAGTDEITIDGHGILNGEIVTYFNNNNSEIGDLVNNTQYYVQVIDLDTIQLSTDLAGSNIVDLGGVLSGTHDIVSSVHLFGYDVSLSYDGKYLAVGVPYASNLNTLYAGELDPVGTYPQGSIVSDRGVLWQALRTVNGDNSTITDMSQDWQPIYLIETKNTGIYSGLTQQGAVCIYEKNSNGSYQLVHTISSPEPRSNEYFGTKVEIRKTSTNDYRLFVGAPGETGIDTGRIYFLDNSNGNWSYSRDRAYKGIWSNLQRYYIDDVVLYNNKQYLALQGTNSLSPVTPGTNSLVWELLTDVDNDFETNMVEHTGYIPHIVQKLEEDNEDVYTNALNIGTKFDINKLGDVLAVSSEYADSDRKVTVYKHSLDRWKFSQVIETNAEKNDFGLFVAVSTDGDMIAISAPDDDTHELNAGIVKVYKNTYNGTNYQFEEVQTISSPKGEQNELFGNGLSFYQNKLAIGSKNADKKVFTTFDRFNDPLLTESGAFAISKYATDTATIENDGTTFDGGVTRFADVEKDVGRIIVFQNIGDRYIYAEDLDYNRNTRLQNISNFQMVDNHLYVGLPKMNPAATLDSTLWVPYSLSDDSTTGMLADLRAEKFTDSWSIVAEQKGKVNLNKIKRSFLYSIKDDDLLTNLDIIDPRQGKIAGPAEQEISFKTFYDPAIYTANAINDQGETVDGIVVDPNNNWTDRYVGTLWWDLSTASWYNPYQGTAQYRTWAWNRLLPNSSIDVYEWVGTELPPSKWRQQADTSAGFAKGISGQPLYDDYVYSTKRVFDSVAQTYRQKFYYWVKNKKVIPQVNNRSLSAYDVARLIESPNSTGYRYVVPLDENIFALYNVKNFVEAKNTVLQFTLSNDENLQTNIHSEYQLLTEGLDTSFINQDIEQKWVDSLTGYDLNSRSVPDRDLSVRQRYGILNQPRQGMFVNRIEAVKQVVERVNDVFKQYQIVDNYNLDTMLSAEVVPSTTLGKYDEVVDTLVDLNYVNTARVDTATFEPIIEKTKIVGVTIVKPGRGYKYPPIITVNDNRGKGAVIYTTINNLGQVTGTTIRSQGKNYTNNTQLVVRDYSVLVNNDDEIGGRWSIFAYNPLTKSWSRTENQDFDTTKYWSYVDWYATGYNESTIIDYVVDQSYELFALNDDIGDIVKINTIGLGGWLLLKKIDNQLTEDYTVNYETIGREDGTIELSTRLYDFTTQTSGYDAQIYDTAFYDREPIQELRNILSALKNDIFVGDLAVEYNKLFFASIKYVFAEQQTVDWAFKTSFVRAKHNLGGLEQRITYQNDNLENYQDYVNEVKPYKTTVREYISSYNQVEPTKSLTTDFDLPPSYNPINLEIETSIAKFRNNQVEDIIARYYEYPYKNWVDNNAYDVVEIRVANPGSGYTQTPIVTIDGDTTAKAYLRRGSVASIQIENKGSKYYTPPTVTIEGSLAEGGTPATAVAVLGNGVVRKAHLTMKFDRVSGSYYITEIEATETFTGTGAKETFDLKYPIDLRVDTYEVTVENRKQLTSDFTVRNSLDTSKGYDRYIGYIDFTDAPLEGETIQITYRKNVSMLNAADRINFFYNPTTGMAGKDLSQLMDGVEYAGAIYNSIGFGTDQGFDVGGFGNAWDTFDNTYQDEIFTIDGSTRIFELSEPTEDGVEYNVYLNGVRIDDPDWDGVTELENENAVMLPIQGDGSTITIELPEAVDPKPGDIVVIRKSTSDGSFTPTNESYDTALSGGNWLYTTATGIEAGDITVDGDGFVTPTTSKGPEELVPGQTLDTLDIKVYHRASDGVGQINTISYRLDQGLTLFELPGIPQSYDSVIVKIDNNIVDPSLWSIDWDLMALEFEDSTSSSTGLLNITTVGTNGINLLDTETFKYDGSTSSVVTKITYSSDLSAFITINGIVQQENVSYTLEESTVDDVYPNRLKIKFEPGFLAEGDFVQYTIYDGRLQQYSQIQIDRTFEADGVNDYFEFASDSTASPIPFNDEPISHRVLVRRNNKILSPGYAKSYTATVDRLYDIETWQFENPTQIRKSEVLVYVENQVLDRSLYSFDPVNGSIQILRNDVVLPGEKLDIFIIKNADYYFVNTELTLSYVDSSEIDLTQLTAVGETIRINAADSSVYEAEIVSLTEDKIVVKKFRQDIYDSFVINNEFDISFNDSDSSYLKITEINFVPTDALTFKEAPSSGEQVEIYTFSNHDVNDFKRSVYDVKTKTYIPTFSDEYTKRNMINRGLFPINTNIQNANYVWVAVNGDLLTPEVDYTVLAGQNLLRLNVIPDDEDRIDILEFGNAPVSPKFGFRIFKDILNRTHYKRLNQENSYVLANPLNYYDVAIYLDDATNIFQPNRSKNIPGVIFIDGERIEYFEVRGNNLLQLRRGTLGTGVKNVYDAGTRVYGQGPEETIDYADKTYRQIFVSDGTSSEYTLDFTPSSIDEVEVFLAGKRLRKNSIAVFNPATALDSNDGDITVESEFRIDGVNIFIEPRNPLTNEIIEPLEYEGQRIEVVRKIGRIWNESGKSLADSETSISKFLRRATIQLPK